MKKLKKEYLAGFTSGQAHDDSDVLCYANLKKMETGIKAQEPMIAAYWQGYFDGYYEMTKYQSLYFG